MAATSNESDEPTQDELTHDELTQQVIEQAKSAVRAFNSGDSAALDVLFAEDAISVLADGSAVSGPERTAGRAELLALRPVMTARILESYVTTDTALLVVDWLIALPGTGAEGAQEHSGLALDVLRRGADGTWRYVIDNPYGTAV